MFLREPLSCEQDVLASDYMDSNGYDKLCHECMLLATMFEPPTACASANDGTCDEPDACDVATDSFDCVGSSLQHGTWRMNSWVWTDDHYEAPPPPPPPPLPLPPPPPLPLPPPPPTDENTASLHDALQSKLESGCTVAMGGFTFECTKQMDHIVDDHFVPDDSVAVTVDLSDMCDMPAAFHMTFQKEGGGLHEYSVRAEADIYDEFIEAGPFGAFAVASIDMNPGGALLQVGIDFCVDPPFGSRQCGAEFNDDLPFYLLQITYDFAGEACAGGPVASIAGRPIYYPQVVALASGTTVLLAAGVAVVVRHKRHHAVGHQRLPDSTQDEGENDRVVNTGGQEDSERMKLTASV